MSLARASDFDLIGEPVMSQPSKCAPGRDMVTTVVQLVCSEIAQGSSARSDAVLCR